MHVDTSLGAVTSEYYVGVIGSERSRSTAPRQRKVNDCFDRSPLFAQRCGSIHIFKPIR